MRFSITMHDLLLFVLKLSWVTVAFLVRNGFGAFLKRFSQKKSM